MNDEVILEAELAWKDLTPEEQEALLESVRTNDYSKFESMCDVEMPSAFTIRFPAKLVDNRHPDNVMLQSRVFVRPKSTGVEKTQ